MIRSALMNVMTAAALKAGRGLKRDLGEVENLQVSIKGPGDFVSAADRKSEKTLFEELSKARPGYGFVLEESGIIEGADKTHTWYIDPLDGTTNFLHGLPIFAISIGLEREGQMVAGLVYSPATDDMYIAEKGQGAYHNNRRLRVAARRDFSSALIGCGIPHLGKKGHEGFQAEFAAVMARAANLRRLGAAALDLCFCRARLLRRLLGTRPETLGHGSGPADHPGSRRFRHRCRRRRGHSRHRLDLRRQRRHSYAIAGAAAERKIGQLSAKASPRAKRRNPELFPNCFFAPRVAMTRDGAIFWHPALSHLC